MTNQSWKRCTPLHFQISRKKWDIQTTKVFNNYRVTFKNKKVKIKIIREKKPLIT